MNAWLAIAARDLVQCVDDFKQCSWVMAKIRIARGLTAIGITQPCFGMS
jgi:hypothetical protein